MNSSHDPEHSNRSDQPINTSKKNTLKKVASKVKTFLGMKKGKSSEEIVIDNPRGRVTLNDFDDYFKSNHVVLVATYTAMEVAQPLSRTKLEGILFVKKDSCEAQAYPTDDRGEFKNIVFDSANNSNYPAFPEMPLGVAVVDTPIHLGQKTPPSELSRLPSAPSFNLMDHDD